MLAERCRDACAGTLPLPGHAALLEAIRRAGGPDFALRVSRGGWHRPGRIVAADGHCVADDALAWLERAWTDAGEDAECFAERHAGCDYRVSRLDGVTHYFVAPCGSGPTGFAQLEVEELRETISHPLIGDGTHADSVEALLERPPGAAAGPLSGPARYIFRRATGIADFVSRIAAQPDKPAPLLRFLADWESSSAGQHRRFSDHWVLALSEHLDRYRQLRRSALPIAAQAPRWTEGPDVGGVALAQRLHDFDRAAGYASAWYFHLVSGHRVPRSVLPAVFADLRDGMAYLPERDADLVVAWMREPYSL
jgi:hypothetical protein